MSERGYLSPKKNSPYSPVPQQKESFALDSFGNRDYNSEEDRDDSGPDLQWHLDRLNNPPPTFLQRLIERQAPQSATQGDSAILQGQEEDEETLREKPEPVSEDKIQARLTSSQPSPSQGEGVGVSPLGKRGFRGVNPLIQREEVEEEEIQTSPQPSPYQGEGEIVSPLAKGGLRGVNPLIQRQEADEKLEEEDKPSVQAKLTIGQPGDKYEQEADNTAAKVMAMPDPVPQKVQRKEEEQEGEIQPKSLAESVTPTVQRRTNTVQRKEGGSQGLESQLAAEKGGGSPLPESVRGFMESRFGADFSEVRVHTGSASVQMNKDIGAQAFTHGNDIYYGKGKSPGKNDLTAHELTHTLQQTGGKVEAKSEVEEKQDNVQSKLGQETSESSVKVQRLCSDCEKEKKIQAKEDPTVIEKEPKQQPSIEKQGTQADAVSEQQSLQTSATQETSTRAADTSSGQNIKSISTPVDQSAQAVSPTPKNPDSQINQGNQTSKTSELEAKNSTKSPSPNLATKALPLNSHGKASPTLNPTAENAETGNPVQDISTETKNPETREGLSPQSDKTQPVADDETTTYPATLSNAETSKPSEQANAPSLNLPGQTVNVDVAPVNLTFANQAESGQGSNLVDNWQQQQSQAPNASTGTIQIDPSQEPSAALGQALQQVQQNVTSAPQPIPFPQAQPQPQPQIKPVEPLAPETPPISALTNVQDTSAESLPPGDLTSGEAQEVGVPNAEPSTDLGSPSESETQEPASPPQDPSQEKASLKPEAETVEPTTDKPSSENLTFEPPPQEIPPAPDIPMGVEEERDADVAKVSADLDGGKAQDNQGLNSSLSETDVTSGQVIQADFENPMDWAKGILESLSGEAASKKGTLQSEGSSKQSQLRSVAQTKGSELTSQGQAKGGELTSQGQAKNTDLISQSQTKGGELTSQGQTKGGELTSQAQTKGGELTSQAQTKGGELTSQSQSQVNELTTQSQAQGTELTTQSQTQGTELTTQSQSKGNELTTQGVAKGNELETESLTKGEELNQESQAQGANLQAASQNQAQTLQTETTTLQDQTVAKQDDIQNQVSQKAQTVTTEATQAVSGIEEGWADLETHARTTVSSLDGEAGELCARYQGKAQQLAQGLDNLPSEAVKQVAAAWESLKQEAQDAWVQFMVKANPVIQAVSEKWDAFNSWARETVWNPIQQKIGEATQWVQEYVGPAGEWINQQWTALSGKAQAGWAVVQEKAGQAWTAVSAKANAAREWVSSKATAAWNWADEKTLGIRTWVGEKATSAKAWVGEKATSAKAWVSEKATSTKAWVGEKMTSAKAWVGETASNAKAWVGEKASSAKAWVGEKATSAKAWVGEKATSAKAWVGEKASSAKAWVTEKAGPAVSWLGDKGSAFVSAVQSKGQAFAAGIRSKGSAILEWFSGQVNSAISGLEGAKNSAVSGLRGSVNSSSTWLATQSNSAANYVEQSGNRAEAFIDGGSTQAANTIAQKGTQAATFIDSKSTTAATLIDTKSATAAQVVETAGSGASTLVETGSTTAATTLESAGNRAEAFVDQSTNQASEVIAQKGNALSQAVKGYGNRAVDAVDAAGTYAIDFLKNPQEQSQKLMTMAGEGVQAGWDWSQAQAGKVADWSQQTVADAANQVNESVIQPASNWAQNQWSKLQGWMTSTFPGLTRCWEVFKEYGSVAGNYLQQKAEQAVELIKNVYPAISAGGHAVLDIVGMVGDFIPGVGNVVSMVADAVNALWYAAEGNWVDAGLSAIAIIPYLGTAAKGGKYVGKGLKYVDDIIGVVSKYGNKVIKVFAQHGDKVFKWAAKYGDEVIAWLTKQGNKVGDLTDDVLEKVFGKKAKEAAVETGVKNSDKTAKKALELPAALAQAKGITEANDAVDTPAPALIGILNATVKRQYSWITRFEARPKGVIGHYTIHMIASDHKIGDYTAPFVGKLRGNEVELPGVSTQKINFTKRPRNEYKQLRSEFNNTVRKNFAKDLASDPAKVKALKEASLAEADIAKLKNGYIPIGYQVHHKIPLDSVGGTNDFDNLILIKNEPYHKTITNTHREAVKDMIDNETRVIDYPIPDGFIYPPK